MNVDDKTHLKIVNTFAVLLSASLFFLGLFYFTHKGWEYYGVFWIGFLLILINFILWLAASNTLERNIKYKNPYEDDKP